MLEKLALEKFLNWLVAKSVKTSKTILPNIAAK